MKTAKFRNASGPCMYVRQNGVTNSNDIWYDDMWGLGSSIFLGRQPRPCAKGAGPQHPPNFRDLLHVHTQYEKEELNFARRSN